MRPPRLFGIALAALALAVTIACGGDDGGNGDGGNGDATATQRPASTQVPLPTITGSTLTSTSKGYEVTIPDGWRPRPNFFSSEGSSTDAYFTGEEQGGVQPNIAVTCSTPVQTLDETLTQTLKNLKAIRNVEPPAVPLQVAGRDARSLRYTVQRQDNDPLEQEDVLLVDDRCVWKLSLVVPSGTFSRFEPDFRAFINSFKLIPRIV